MYDILVVKTERMLIRLRIYDNRTGCEINALLKSSKKPRHGRIEFRSTSDLRDRHWTDLPAMKSRDWHISGLKQYSLQKLSSRVSHDCETFELKISRTALRAMC